MLREGKQKRDAPSIPDLRYKKSVARVLYHKLANLSSGKDKHGENNKNETASARQEAD